MACWQGRAPRLLLPPVCFCAFAVRCVAVAWAMSPGTAQAFSRGVVFTNSAVFEAQVPPSGGGGAAFHPSEAQGVSYTHGVSGACAGY
eukprot:11188308-Lingulodinium_polyedra.AAC.1